MIRLLVDERADDDAEPIIILSRKQYNQMMTSLAGRTAKACLLGDDATIRAFQRWADVHFPETKDSAK